MFKNLKALFVSEPHEQFEEGFGWACVAVLYNDRDLTNHECMLPNLDCTFFDRGARKAFQKLEAQRKAHENLQAALDSVEDDLRQTCSVLAQAQETIRCLEQANAEYTKKLRQVCLIAAPGLTTFDVSERKTAHAEDCETELEHALRVCDEHTTHVAKDASGGWYAYTEQPKRHPEKPQWLGHPNRATFLFKGTEAEAYWQEMCFEIPKKTELQKALRLASPSAEYVAKNAAGVWFEFYGRPVANQFQEGEWGWPVSPVPRFLFDGVPDTDWQRSLTAVLTTNKSATSFESPHSIAEH